MRNKILAATGYRDKRVVVALVRDQIAINVQDTTTGKVINLSTKPTPRRRIVLVYQAGIANVFEVEGRNMGKRKRLLQSYFRDCESFARGCAAMGANVETMACNRAGDIVDEHWSTNLDEQPFSDKFCPVIAA